MKKLLLLSVLLMISNTSIAQVMLDQLCANGGGYVFKGKYEGEFCMSKQSMTWWDAHAWCNAVGMRLIELSDKDCVKPDDLSWGVNHCYNIISQPWPSEFVSYRLWTANPKGTSRAYCVNGSNANVCDQERKQTGMWGGYALCAH